MIDDPSLDKVFTRVIDEATDVWLPVEVKYVSAFIYEVVSVPEEFSVFEFGVGEKIRVVRALIRGNEFTNIAIRHFEFFSFEDAIAFKAWEKMFRP
ncbi:MAG: hypothetical protein O9322_02640 [Beijerinckiaceae bacterium]|nr:hypothetical protein [Beijerinckiaceae bacterium]